ncbi:MAG: arsenate reductase ArsC [Bacillota bacterium]
MKKIAAYICVGNSCRSQMAEGFTKELAGDILEVYSAGTHPSEQVNPNAVKVMDEIGIDISEQYPKHLSEIPEKVDFLVTMGCGVECPYIPTSYRTDWGLDDPDGKPVEEFRKTRNIIEEKVKNLIKMIKDEKYK